MPNRTKYIILPAVIALIFFGVLFTAGENAYAQGTARCEWGVVQDFVGGPWYEACRLVSECSAGFARPDELDCRNRTQEQCEEDVACVPVEEVSIPGGPFNTGGSGSLDCSGEPGPLNLNVNWPRIGVGTDASGNTRRMSLNDMTGDDLTFENLINWLYAFFLWTAGIVAFISIVFAGFSFVFSGANPSIRARARERMKNTLIGLGIIMVVVLMVNVINPDILTLQISGTADVFGTCPTTNIEFGGRVESSEPHEPIITDNHSSCRWDVGRVGIGSCRQIDRCEDGYVPNITCSVLDREQCDAAAEQNYPCITEEEEAEQPPENPEIAGTFLCTATRSLTCVPLELDGGGCNSGYAPDPSVCSGLSVTGGTCTGSYPCIRAIP